jgi:HAD superfamily hydrolase (TIGR01450 family)
MTSQLGGGGAFSPPLIEYRFIIVDLDGTLVAGRKPLPGAVELIELFQDRCAVVSNNSSHSVAQLAGELRSCGLPIRDSQLVLAGITAIETIASDYAGARTMIVASDAVRQVAEERGLHAVEDKADVVLLTRDEGFTYPKLRSVVDAVASGAILVAANPDLTHPGPDAGLIPETGAILSSVLSCVKPRILRTIGKPEPYMFVEGIRRLDADPRTCLVVGDNPDTDRAGAARLGLASLMVGRGPGAEVEDLHRLARLLQAAASQSKSMSP